MKWFLIACAIILMAGVYLSSRHVNFPHELDMLEVNRIVTYAEQSWRATGTVQLPRSPLMFAFAEEGASLHAHIQNRNTIVPFVVDGYHIGFIVFYSQIADRLAVASAQFSSIFYVQLAALVVVVLIFVLHQHKTILRPFKKLEAFASRVAAGDLDSPLTMDGQNRFGAFSESFDIMREQLAIARENERQANISKKELVASLSHDIKTPATSIKIVAELHQAKHGVSDEMQLIVAKIDQIDLLITNMFSATLEELTQLKVCVAEVSTIEMEEDIRAADYKQKIRPFKLPECVLTVDRLRFKQIMDNVIGNSYKYADTEIEVTGSFEDEYFILTVRDFGAGVSNDEIGLLREKFYRAANADGKNGTGLGLYLTGYFLEKMGATLAIENMGGLCVVMRFRI